MSGKEIIVARYGYTLVSCDWAPAVDLSALKGFVQSLHDELNKLGLTVRYVEDHDVLLEVKGYGDLLNTIRLRSPSDHIGNLCLGHIIGQSANCDLFEDVRRGVSRVAFAPEMIEPEGSHKVVCHNCGCGC